MSASAVKATRREIRRAFGPQAVHVLAETQQNTNATVASVTQAHQRIDGLADQHEAACAELTEAIAACQARLAALDAFRQHATMRQRLRWLVKGR